MARTRLWFPPPHAASHTPQPLHGVNVQFSGQANALHGALETSCGHAKPLPVAAWMMLRVRVVFPPPHDAPHSDHSLHIETSQSVGHVPLLQTIASNSTGHVAPPSAAGVVTSRVRWRVPPPHGAVQLPHSCHAPTTQSTAQASTLQTTDSVSSGHDVPPLDAGVTIERACTLTPPPHQAEQLPKTPQSDTAQCTGQSCVLHGSDS